MKFSAFLLPVAMAGFLAAQTTPAPQTHHGQRHSMADRMTAKLNLSQDQQAKAHTIFEKARAQEKALRPKLQEERVALKSAVRTDNEGQIDRVLQQNSQLNTQAREIHTKAVAQFYQILNPSQKAQFDQMSAHRWGNHANKAGSATESR